MTYMNNILFFLTPKSELDLVYEDDSISEALDRIERHEFTSIPIINEKTGRYVGTISEGDFLRAICQRERSGRGAISSHPVNSIRRKCDFRSVRIDSTIQELFSFAKDQNFVPVVDDTGVLIGIVTRSAILEYAYQVMDKFIDKEKAGIA